MTTIYWFKFIPIENCPWKLEQSEFSRSIFWNSIFFYSTQISSREISVDESEKMEKFTHHSRGKQMSKYTQTDIKYMCIRYRYLFVTKEKRQCENNNTNEPKYAIDANSRFPLDKTHLVGCNCYHKVFTEFYRYVHFKNLDQYDFRHSICLFTVFLNTHIARNSLS